MKKFLINILLFMALAAVCDMAIGFISSWLSSHARSGETRKRELIRTGITPDILILGSSRAFHHYDPEIIQDSLHMSCFVAGEEGNGIKSMLPILMKIQERETPKIVIYDYVPYIDFYEYDQSRSLKVLRSLWGTDREIDSIILRIDPEERYKLLSNAYRYNSSILKLLKDQTPDNGEVTLGYAPYIGTMTTEETLPADKQEIKEISELNIELLNRMTSICKKDSIKLVFVVSPFYDYSDDKGMAFIRALCRKNDIPLYDFSSDPKYYRKKEYFYDLYHMNQQGAEAFSKDLATKLIQILGEKSGKDS